MARSFLTSLNLNQNELQNGRIQNLAAAPGSPVPGQVYYDTVLLASYIWNGTTWQPTDASKSTIIPVTALTTNPLARANHTGTQLSATISDLAATVQAYRLDQFALPTANLNVNSHKITGVSTPTTAGDAAEYSWVIGQVQSSAAGIASKPPVRLVATTNQTLTGAATIDSVAVVTGDRVLLTGQTTASQNGVYNANTAGAWTRTTVDGAAPGEIETGAMFLVTEGTTFTASQWRVSTTGVITIGSTAVTIVQFGAASVYTGSNGILLTGSNFTAVADPVSGGGISVSSTGIKVDTAVVARKFSATIGDGVATSIVVTHSLGTQDVMLIVRQAGSPFAVVECDMSATSTTQATFAFTTAPASNAYRVTVIG